MILNRLFQLVVTASFMGSIVAGIIFLIKALLKDKFSAVCHYYIWFLLIVRLIIPYAPETSFSIFNVFSPPSRVIEGYMNIQGRLDSNIKHSNIVGDKQGQEEGNIGQSLGDNSRDLEVTRKDLNKYFKLESLLNSMQKLWIAGAIIVILYNIAMYIILLYD